MRQDVPSSPADFGGLIGGAERELGGDLAKTGAELVSSAVSQQGLYNQIASQDAFNQLQTQYTNLTYGDPHDPTKKGIYQLHGKDAMDAYESTRESLDSTRDGILSGLKTDAQRLSFQEASRRLQTYTLEAVGRHVDAQNQVYGKDVATAQYQTQLQQAGLNYNDPRAINEAAYGARNAAISVAKMSAGQGASVDPVITENAMAGADATIVQRAVSARALNDPAGALDMLNNGTLPPRLPGDKPVRYIDALTAEQKEGLVKPLIAAQEKAQDAAYIRGLMGGGAASSLGTGGISGGNFDAAKGQRVDQATTQRAAAVHDGLVRRGLDSDTAWGFAANAVHESRADPQTGAGDMGAAHGTFMWRDSDDGGKRLTNYVQQNGHLPEKGTLDEQLDHVMWELHGTESGAWQQIQGTSGGAGAKAAAVSKFFERPKDTQAEMARRAGTANQLSGSPSAPPGPSAPVIPIAAGVTGAQPPVSGVINPGQAQTPSPAEAALPDIDKIVERVQRDFPDDIVRQEKLVAQVKSQYNLMLSATQNERKDLVSSVHDMMAAAVSGQDITINEAHIRHLLPPAVAAQTIEELNTSVSAGQQFKALQWGTPQQVTDAYQTMSAGLGANPRGDRIAQATMRGETVGEELPPEPTEDQNTPEQYRYRQRLQNMFAAKMLQRNQMLATDSYGYVSQNPIVRQKAAVLTAAVDAAKGAPETDPRAVAAKVAMNDLFRTSLNIQEQLGVPAPLQHIMTKARAQSAAQDLMNADPATTDVGASLDKMGKDYGPFWNQAYGDIKTLGKLPPDYQVLAMTVDPVARNDVQRMLKFVHEKGGVEKLHDIAGKNNMQLINNAIEDSPGPLRDFVRSINVPGIYGNGDSADMMKNAVRNLAAYRTMGGSTDGTAAAEKSAADLIGAKYDFDDRLRVPKGTMRPVENYGDTMLQGLSGNDIRADDGRRTLDIASSPIPGVDERVQRDIGGEIAADKKVEVWRRVRDTGKWVTNESDSGAFLTAQSAEGVPYTVRRPDGKRIEFSFKEAVAGNPPRPSTPDPLMMIP